MSLSLSILRTQSNPSHASVPRSTSSRYSSTSHFHQQIHQLYSLAPYGILGSLMNGGILVALLWTILPQRSMAVWCFGLLIINGLWSWLLYRYRQETHHEATLDRWVHLFLAGNFASGCIWGFGGIGLYPSTSRGHEVFLTFVFGGMIAGATALYASHFPAFLAFALPTATPLTFLFFFQRRLLAYRHGSHGDFICHYHDSDSQAQSGDDSGIPHLTSSLLFQPSSPGIFRTRHTLTFRFPDSTPAGDELNELSTNVHSHIEYAHQRYPESASTR